MPEFSSLFSVLSMLLPLLFNVFFIYYTGKALQKGINQIVPLRKEYSTLRMEEIYIYTYSNIKSILDMICFQILVFLWSIYSLKFIYSIFLFMLQHLGIRFMYVAIKYTRLCVDKNKIISFNFLLCSSISLNDSGYCLSFEDT